MHDVFALASPRDYCPACLACVRAVGKLGTALEPARQVPCHIVPAVREWGKAGAEWGKAAKEEWGKAAKE